MLRGVRGQIVDERASWSCGPLGQAISRWTADSDSVVVINTPYLDVCDAMALARFCCYSIVRPSSNVADARKLDEVT